MIISTYDFAYYKDFTNGAERFPDLTNNAFSMSLQAENIFYNAIVTYDFVFKALNIEFYDENDKLIQPRKRCAEGINLFYLIGYYLVWDIENNRFVFGKGSEDEILSPTN